MRSGQGPGLRLASRVRMAVCIACALASFGVDARSDAAEKEYHDPGVYITAGIMPIVPTLKDTGPVGFKPALGGSAVVGYRVVSPLAVQVRGAWLGTGFSANDPYNIGTNVNAATVTGDIKLFILSGRVQPFALVGAGTMWGKIKVPAWSSETTKTWSSVVRVGGGFDFWAEGNVFVGFGAYYVMPQQDLSDLRYVEIEILQVGYRF